MTINFINRNIQHRRTTSESYDLATNGLGREGYVIRLRTRFFLSSFSFFLPNIVEHFGSGDSYHLIGNSDSSLLKIYHLNQGHKFCPLDTTKLTYIKRPLTGSYNKAGRRV